MKTKTTIKAGDYLWIPSGTVTTNTSMPDLSNYTWGL